MKFQAKSVFSKLLFLCQNFLALVIAILGRRGFYEKGFGLILRYIIFSKLKVTELKS